MALALPASAVLAQGNPDNVRYTYATVLSASPAFETVRYSEPREECEDQRVIYRERDEGTAGAIVGAIVGGVVGNQVGGGSGRRAATVAGAVAGGTIGRNVDRNNSPQRQYEGSERRCRVVEVVREERRQAGFDVEYRLYDEVFHARLPYDPGNNLRVRVSVSPVE
ncbi:MAG: glycine zipper 2TM domain-containing protein [Aquimonas sp.]|nr:glycine zipper 2TM domain-containing protein [Aquimonas sp.]